MFREECSKTVCFWSWLCWRWPWLACTGVQAKPAAAQQTVPAGVSLEAQRFITVVGVGRVSLVPDVAKINVGVETRAGTVAEAKETVDQQMEAIPATLKELGVAEKDIQTSYYSIYYEQEPYQPMRGKKGRPAPQARTASPACSR